MYAYNLLTLILPLSILITIAYAIGFYYLAYLKRKEDKAKWNAIFQWESEQEQKAIDLGYLPEKVSDPRGSDAVKRFNCIACGKLLSSRYDVQWGSRRVEQGVREFKVHFHCPVCDVTFPAPFNHIFDLRRETDE